VVCVHRTDRFVAGSIARRFARSIGFDESGANDVGICAGELASNAVRHAGSGVLEVREISTPSRGVEIEVRDEGPGIEDPSLAVLDGWSRGQMMAPDVRSDGLGKGLGAVLRLVDDATIDSSAKGTTVTVRRYIRRRRGS
jgi:serine/threonine-protein kinase RsbT